MADAAPFLLLALMAAISWFGGRGLPAERLPMQWNLAGQPTWYAPRLVALWFPVVVAVLLQIFTWMVSGADTPSWTIVIIAVAALAAQVLYLALLHFWWRRVN